MVNERRGQIQAFVLLRSDVGNGSNLKEAGSPSNQEMRRLCEKQPWKQTAALIC